jgi:hypothetical protein
VTNCDQQVARRGWQIYQATTPPPSLAAINDVLEGSVHASISPRTYKHYRRMKLHGFEEYLPINELDVRLKLRGRRPDPGQSSD